MGKQVAKTSRGRWLSIFTLLLLAVGSVSVLTESSAEGTDQVVEVFPPRADPSLLPDGADLAAANEKVEREEAERELELESPAAEAERLRSETAYREVESAAAVSDLLRETFDQELTTLEQDSARFLTDAALRQSLGKTDARVWSEGETEIVEGTTPVRMPDEEGDLRKVDLSLEQVGAGFELENPIVELGISASAAEGIEVGGETTIAQAGADPAAGAHPFGEKDVIYPEVLPDTDLLVSPIATGVELFNQLRSPLSPETLRFDLALPAGAELRANAGAAEVYEGGELRAIISPPSAVDAQGTRVHVTMDVDGDALVLSVPHRQAEYAYPILVDPEYTQNDWVNGGWMWGGGYAALEDGTFLPNWNNSKILTNRWCLNSCWGSGRGLFVSVPSGSYSAQQWAYWSFTPPGETTYLTGYLINPFFRYDFPNCTQYSEPHDYDGLWEPHPPYYGWTAFNTGRAATATNSAVYGSVGGETFIFGMSTGSGSNTPCWRDLYAGGIATYMTDPDWPTLDPISGYPTGWFDDSKNHSVNVSAYDAGLGVQNVQLNIEGKPQVLLKPAPCYGTHDSPCLRDMSGPIVFNGDNFPEGLSLAKVVASDALARPSGLQYFWAYVDNTPPEVTLSGQLAKATNEAGSEEVPAGKGDQLALPVYNLTIKATDGSNGSDKTRRSGMKSVEVFIDDKKEPETVPWSPQPTPCENCEMTQTYTLKLNTLEAGKHTLRVVATDQLGHPRERHIEFEFIPATGMRDEYVMQYFPLPDGQGNEAEEEHPSRPELAVNVINGNLVYREEDVDVEGYGADLEVERYYNSLLPESENTEWGDGWTLAQTPELDPEAGAVPQEAEILDTSGALESEVQLPTEVGKSNFDPALQATLTKEAGGYELQDESGETGTAIAFDGNGRAEELRTEGYARVEYDYAAGDLEEIAVKDPASASDLSPAEEEALEYVPPAPTFQSAFGALGTGDGQLKSPGDVAVALNGDLFVVDRANNRVQRFTTEGKFVSKFGVSGSGNGQFNRPCAIAIDPSGNLWVADANNHRIQKFNEKGDFLKAVGSLGSGIGQFKEPEGIATDAKGNVLVADSFNQRIQKFNAAGEYLAKFGSAGSGNGQFNQVNSIDVGPGGGVWVVDWGQNKVTQFNEGGEFVQKFGAYGTGNGQFNHPDAIEVDSRGNVWVGDQSNNRIQQFNQAGKYLSQFGSKGSGAGQFSFTWPMGIAVDNKGSLWVADVSNNRIQRWSVPGYRPTWFGALGSLGSGDGQLKAPADAAIAQNGDVWIADKENNRLQRFDASGQFVSKFGAYGTGNGQFSRPAGIAIDGSNNIWVADSGNHRIQQFDEDGVFIQAIGGLGNTNGKFSSPESIATDLKGNIYVADTQNKRVQVFDEAGAFLFKFGSLGSGPGQFQQVNSIDIGRGGSIWVADWWDNRVSQFNEKGEFIKYLGSVGTGDGQFNRPAAVEADSEGNVFLTDQSNGRILVFNEAAEYLTQFGSKGAGDGQFNFVRPSGLATDPSGNLWVVDPSNNRIQKWLLPDIDPPKAPEENDPSLQIETSEGLVSEASGEEAGEHVYEHTGDLLSSHEGPQGETTYEYDAAGRMTKVTLPNGTWGSIAYDATYGWVTKVTVDPAGSDPAKSTSFSYSSEPRRTTVTPDKAPVVTYDIGEDGSILKWQNVVKPPSFDNISGSLYVGRENPTPINTGVHNLGVHAYSDEGIASIQIVANGTYLVSEKTCEQDPETPELECISVKDEWVTETEDHAPGTLYVEAIIEDRLGQVAAQRFWVNIPQPPPPPPDGAPAKPKFKDILNFREEFGLEVWDPVADETELNERIFNLINAWTEGDPVARASWERWGVPMRARDVAELEYREWYYDVNAELIGQWVDATQPTSFAGYYIDHRAGGIMHIGFLDQQTERLASLMASLSLKAGERLQAYPATPTASLLSVRQALQSVTNAIESNASLASLVVNVEEDEAGKAVRIGTPNVAQVEGILGQMIGPNAPIAVEYDAGGGSLLSGRFRNEGRMRAGDAIFTKRYTADVPGAHIRNSMCTAGFGAKDKAGEVRGAAVWQLFVLTAGHCSGLNNLYENNKFRSTDSDLEAETSWKEVGRANRDALKYFEWVNTDAEAIRVKGSGIVPQGIFGWDGGLIHTSPAGKAKIGNTLCFSGARTQVPQCGPIVARSVRWFSGEDSFFRGGYWVRFKEPAQPGDSGAPVWRPTCNGQSEECSIGLVTASRPNTGEETLVEPLLHPPNLAPNQVVGILHNEHLDPLSLKVGGE